MVMTYGDIDKSKQKRDDLDIIIKNLQDLVDNTDFFERPDLEKYAWTALETAIKLKGDS